MERLRKGQRIEHYETVRLRKDGELIDISLSVSPLAMLPARSLAPQKSLAILPRGSAPRRSRRCSFREMSHRVKNAFTVVNGIWR